VMVCYVKFRCVRKGFVHHYACAAQRS
jgi:hypothetical protein